MSTIEKQSLTLNQKLVSAQKVVPFQGMEVPWEVDDYAAEYLKARQFGGVFDLSDYVCIEIQGKDAQDYLQRMTTVQFKNLNLESVVHGAFLTGRGGVIALGVFIKKDNETFHFLIGNQDKQKVLEHIEQFHFAEQFTVKDLSLEYSVFGCWSSDGNLAKNIKIKPDCEPLKLQQIQWKNHSWVTWKDIKRTHLFWIVLNRSEAVSFVKDCLKENMSFLGRHLFEFFRLEAGVPWAGNELTEKDIILEGNFLEAVARNKGCYPGQEVVERIFTYGQVNRKLLRVTLKGNLELLGNGPVPFSLQGTEAGELIAWQRTPNELHQGVGLMFVRKGYWDSKENFHTQVDVAATLSV